MSKFDTLFKAIISECKLVKEEISEEDFTNKVKELVTLAFEEEFADKIETEFKDDAEKQAYIENLLDTKIEGIAGAIEEEPEEFMTLADDVKLEKIVAIMKTLSEDIFGKQIS